jgi:Protein of unknown function (DUF2948)
MKPSRGQRALQPEERKGDMADLKLQALDGEDLAIISAQCQDAVVRVADLVFRPKEQRFVLICNRFDWVSAGAGGTYDRNGQGYERRRAGLRFEHVRRAQVTGFDPTSSDAVLALLAITFAPTEAPAGQITLHFAAGGAVRLEVDYIEAELKDLGAVWATAHKPDHGASDQPAPTKPSTDQD